MFRTLSRLLRNNHIIRILAICQIVALVSFVPIFAQPTTQDVSGMTQTVYNFTLWSDFTTNVDYYYGSQTASYSDTTITTIARWLNQIKYYYADQTQTLYMYVPSTNTIQSVTGRHIPEILSYLNYNMAQDAKMNYESELLLSRLVTQMGGTNGSYVQDIALDVDSYLPSLTELTDIKNLLLKEGINSTVLYDSRYSERYIRPGVNCSVSLSNGVFSLTNFTGNYPVQSIFTIPMYQNQYTFVRFEIYTPKELTISPLIYSNAAETFRIPSNSWITITSYKQPSSFGSGAGGFTITDSNLTSSDVVRIKNVQYITSPDLAINNEILNSINNMQVSVDTTDIIDAINNLSLQDNDVKLNLTINNNTGSDGTNIIGRLQNFFNTGTSVSDFFDNVDDAESGWFTQTNSDLINTLSGGYVDLYE